MTFEQGPYIQVAAFCAHVLQEKTDVFSLIRIIDSLTHVEKRPDAPEEMPPVTYHLKLVLMFKSGSARGRHEIRVVPELPSGETLPPFISSVQFSGEERGVNVIASIPFTFNLEGLYWFNVHLDNELLTRMPFRVIYNRVVTSS